MTAIIAMTTDITPTVVPTSLEQVEEHLAKQNSPFSNIRKIYELIQDTRILDELTHSNDYWLTIQLIRL